MKSRVEKPSVPFLQRHQGAIVIGALLFIILLTAAERLRFLSVPLERDEGEYAYAGQIILRGFPPYRYAYNMKFPGVYAAYALVMSVFGETIAGIRIGLLIVNVATILLLFLVARRLMDPLWALAAAASFAFLSFGEPVLGSFAHATHFVMLFAIAGSLTLLRGVDEGRATWLVMSGALFGLAVLMKQHGVFFILFAAAYIAWGEYRARNGSIRALLTKLAALMLGVAIPLALTVLLLWRAGVFGKFWFWTFKYATQLCDRDAPINRRAHLRSQGGRNCRRIHRAVAVGRGGVDRHLESSSVARVETVSCRPPVGFLVGDGAGPLFSTALFRSRSSGGGAADKFGAQLDEQVSKQETHAYSVYCFAPFNFHYRDRKRGVPAGGLPFWGEAGASQSADLWRGRVSRKRAGR
jgi:4-amino-4-deoxy-L-arabinose transferase-like glycosyltransferase